MKLFLNDPKLSLLDTGWVFGSIPPRYAPIFKKSKPMPIGWEWRAARLLGGHGDYVLLLQAVPTRNKYSAWLMQNAKPGEGTLLIRVEDQPGKRGLHVHVDCAIPAPNSGPQGLDGLPRIPGHGAHHRRTHAWTRETFWRQACDMLRVIPADPDPQGELQYESGSP
jgi:hypothetical protein